MCGEPWRERCGCRDDEVPRLSFGPELMERKRQRQRAFRLGLHPRAGVESVVRVLPVEIVDRILKL